MRPGWGGGRVRSTAIELEPLGRDESEAACRRTARRSTRSRGRSGRAFSTRPRAIRCSSRRPCACCSRKEPSGSDRIPDSLQALIGARIDRLPAGEKIMLQRGSVIGRIFWAGAIDYLSPEYDADELEDMLDDLLLARLRHTRSALDDQRRVGVSLQARADPRGRVRRSVEVRARRIPHALRRVAA